MRFYDVGKRIKTMFNSKCVAVVEDDETFAYLVLASLYQKLGFMPDHFSSFAELQASGKHYDLYVLDNNTHEDEIKGEDFAKRHPNNSVMFTSDWVKFQPSFGKSNIPGLISFVTAFLGIG